VVVKSVSLCLLSSGAGTSHAGPADKADNESVWALRLLRVQGANINIIQRRTFVEMKYWFLGKNDLKSTLKC
jgi:hypothetical protein